MVSPFRFRISSLTIELFTIKLPTYSPLGSPVKIQILHVVFASLFCISILGSGAYAQTDENLQAAIENQLSFRSWDYLMELETIDDVPGVGVGSGKSVIRHIADLDKNIQILIVYSTVEDSNKSGDGRETKKRMSAFKTVDKRTEQFKSNGDNAKGSESLYDVLFYQNIPDFRGICLIGFPIKFADPSLQHSAVMSLANLKTMQADYKSSVSQGIASVTFSADFRPSPSGGPREKLILIYSLDTKRFVSTSFLKRYLRNESESKDVELQICKWSEVNNQSVPVDLQVYHDTLYVPPDRDPKKVVPYERVTRVLYHWFSVNEDVSDIVSKTDIYDNSKVLEMIDPEFLEAYNILELKEN